MASDNRDAPITDQDAESVRLVALVDQLVAQARGGVAVDIERVASEHPDLATELRELWAVVALAEEFGSHSAADSIGEDSPGSASAISRERPDKPQTR